jgi:HAD superfamily hydrolase (TIGR01549 family)
MIKVIIFDLWDTLIYSKDKAIFKEYNQLIKDKLGKSYKDSTYRQNITEEQTIHDMKTLSSQQDAKRLKSLLRKQNENCTLYKETIELLKDLKKNYKLGIISNTNSIAKKQIYNLQLDKYIDIIVLSCDVNLVKPNNKIFELALKQLKIKPEEALYVGDIYDVDIVGAKNAGLNAILIDRNNYYPEIKDKIKDLTELKSVLQRFQ